MIGLQDRMLTYLRSRHKPQTSAQVAEGIGWGENGKVSTRTAQICAAYLVTLRRQGYVRCATARRSGRLVQWVAVPDDDPVELARRLVIAVCERVIDRLDQ
jgi:hypothetical protein